MNRIQPKDLSIRNGYFRNILYFGCFLGYVLRPKVETPGGTVTIELMSHATM